MIKSINLLQSTFVIKIASQQAHCPMPRTHHKLIRAFLTLVFLVFFLVSCNFPSLSSISSEVAQNPPGTELPQSQVTFTVSIPQALPVGDSIYLTILDEVTGLSFNQHKYIMQAEDAFNYTITLPFTQGKVLKYRYTRQGSTTVDEHLYNDRPVRYRILNVEGSATVSDVISRWTDTEIQGPTGRIMGEVLDRSTSQPIPNLLVTAGGEQAFTMADGSFLLEGLPPGTHNLVFYAMDGSYQVYQQGAVVAADSTTPVSISLDPAQLVTVIFTISVPPGTPQDAPIRLAGSLSQLGNTFADLSGGVSALAMRMPVMGKLADGRYMLTLNLPAGTYLEYKYTLGDGLWSSELTTSGDFRLRQMLVPTSMLEQDDTVESWQAPGTQPVLISVNVPQNTPQGEHVSIQFNPGFGWMEPLPMQPIIGSQAAPQWRFNLTGPLNKLSSLYYRYCRQEQCGAADDSATLGPASVGREMSPAANPGTISDIVTSWAWLEGSTQPVTVPNVQVAARSAGFTAAVAFQSNFLPSYTPLLDSSIKQLTSLGVNGLVLEPSWTFTNNNPPILESLPSQDIPIPDLLSTINSAQANQLDVALFPQPNFPAGMDRWWQDATKDFPWWIAFYERYKNFIVNFADVASTTNSPALVLGGDWLDPALPEGKLADGSSANVPVDSEVLWRQLIKHLQDTYRGKLVWALSYPDGIKDPPPFLDAFDEIYILWSAPLASQPNTPLDQLQFQAATILDEEISPFQQRIGKPVILALSYPSIDQSYTGCIPITGDQCFDYAQLAQPNPDIPQLNLNLQAQADAYNAVLSAINDRPWIAGYISMGYYPPALLQDKSTSIHGKPTASVLLFWSQKYLGK
jgi:hypothetical protein